MQVFLRQIDKKDVGFDWRFLVLSILSAVILSLCFPKFNVFIFAWVCLIPLIHCVLNSKSVFSVIYGFAAGFVFGLISIYWMLYFLEINTRSFSNSIILSFIVWGYFGIYFAVWAGLLNFAKKYLDNVKLILFSGAVWVILEYIRTYAMSGFPINSLAYSQSIFYPIIQIADITGFYGVSFVIMAINMLLYFYLQNKNKKYLLAAGIIIGALLLYGLTRVAQFNGEYGDRKLTVGVIQPNIEQHKKWRGSYAAAILNTLRKGANSFADKNVDIMLYPETVLPRRLEESKDVQEMVRQVSRLAKLTLIGGMSDENKKKYNSVFVLSQNGQIAGKYKKRRLVIFGEYLPFRGLLSKFLKSLSSINTTGELSKEKELEVFKFGDVTLGINICSERYYPDLSRALVLKGANILTNHTNDAWFLGMATPYQNFIINTFRAVETRKNLIVAANTGVSAIINSSGKCTEKTRVGENVSFTGNVYTNNYKSLYVAMGDIFVYMCMIFVVWCLLFCILKKYQFIIKKI
ncbi:MAG: apolipoprotein N-acyltransferase [Endomicrobium sp.]|nr:apolipoprotein N-acyltransferase [Endomicrobium sp.]